MPQDPPPPNLDPADPYIRFEVLDRSHTILVMLSTLLEEHPGLQNGELGKLYDLAGDALGDLYAEAGRIALK